MISHLDIVARLLVAAILGSAIGFERERLLRAAGVRTHMLVSVGACLVMIVSAYGFQNATKMPHVVLDPSRMAAQVVSGIGFLGAGSILLRNEVVRGLTTAASIWAVAAIGLACGGGLYFAAVLATAVILVILAGVKPLEEAYRARVQSCVLDVVSDPGAVDPARLKEIIGVHLGQIRQVITTSVDNGTERTEVRLQHVSQQDIRTAAAKLRQVPGTRSVEVVRAFRSESGD